MKKYLFFAGIISLLACSNESMEEKKVAPSFNKSDLTKEQTGYTLIRDNLYANGEGILYLKTINNEDFDDKGNLYPKDTWLKTVYCDTCWTSTEDGWTDITELKDFVDMQTWHLDTSNASWTDYVDKQFRYHHTHMADGGTISLQRR